MLEANNSLTTSSITWTKYVKPPHLCSPNQRNAHVIIGLSNKEDANKIIQHGLYIEGKHTTIHKMVATPKRCLKWQYFRHYTSDCKATADTCALCTLNHCTNLCPTPDSPPKCANCTGESATRHRLADKDCPSLLSETHKLHQCNPKNKYKFFPTNDPNTWKLLSEPELAPPHTHSSTIPQHHIAQYPP